MDFRIKNFTMEKFNNDVNNSGDLDSKCLNWTEYRGTINDFILKSIEGKSRKSIFVFGAGECNDVDLSFLADHFDKITLSDIDTKSIDDGIKRQGLNGNVLKKINKVQADYTGLSHVHFFENLSQMVNQRKSQDEISSYIKTTIGNLKTEKILSQHRKIYDVVLVMPTYTQLAYTQMEALLRILYQYNIYKVDDLNKIITSMYHSMPKILDRYNDLVLSLIADNGMLIMLADIMEITDMQTKEDIISRISDIDYIKKYLSTNCSDLAQMGINSLDAKIEISNEKYALWPFDEGKDYVVSMLAGCKRIE